MNDMMKKLLMSKMDRGQEMSDDESEAQGSVLKDLRGSMGGLMGDKLKGLKKVTVASNSPQGLEQGLDTAKDVLGQDGMGTEGSPEEEQMESPEDEVLEKASLMSSEELDSLMQKLQMLKDQKQPETDVNVG